MNTRLNKIVLASALFCGLAASLPASAQSSMASDAAIAEQVKAALAQVRPLKDADVDIAVKVSNGVADLSGWVTYADDIQTAEHVVASVAGVKQVTDHFHVWSSSGRPGL